MLLCSEVTFPFYLWLIGGSEPNLQATSNNPTKLYNTQYCVLTLPLLSSYLPTLFSSSSSFAVYLNPFLFTVLETYLKYFFGTRYMI